eukprot:750717-Hanusia_phi.AAC.2
MQSRVSLYIATYGAAIDLRLHTLQHRMESVVQCTAREERMVMYDIADVHPDVLQMIEFELALVIKSMWFRVSCEKTIKLEERIEQRGVR